jgi:2-octaprenyl-6-methoxyphenol hydroxylase
MRPDTPQTVTPVAVVGGGPAGMVAALALVQATATHTMRFALVTRESAAPATPLPTEARTAALFRPALDLLDGVGAWADVRPASAPMAALRIVDRTAAPLRAPEVLFEAAEIGLPDFGSNVPNGPLAAALREAVHRAVAAGRLIWYAGVTVTDIAHGADGVTLRLSTGATVTAALVVAADGRESPCRAAAGITAEARDTGQVAVTATFAHTRPHDNVSTEIHRASGPLTTVPLPGHRSSLVWMERTAIAERLLALDDAAFTASLQTHLGPLLGTVSDVSPRGRFDLAYVRAHTLAARRTLLVGEAAHAMPPIGAQGLNLSLRDVAAMAEIVGAALAAGRDPGGADVRAAYAARRSGDVALRMGAVEALNGSLLADSGLVNLARGAGLHVVRAVGPLRRELMRRGLAG